jgi:hypothetical protein
VLAACIGMAAEPQTAPREFTPAERWVVAQVNAGEIADLTQQIPEQDKRKISAHFVEDLLTGTLPGVKPNRQGVRIIGAIIDEPIELTDAEIHCRVWLAKCQFLSGVTFTRTNFEKVTTFDSSTFKAEVDFTDVKFGQGAFLNNAVFEGPVDFLAANIAGAFRADKARFKNKERAATFNGMKVGQAAIFRNAVFEGPVDFAAADIAREFAADEARFENRADFFRMKVGDSAFFYNAVFEGPVDFLSAYIVGNFDAVKAQFKNEKESANFNSLKVGRTAFFRNAVFEGTADFLLADIAGNFEAQDAQFRNKEQGAYFYGMKVGQIASFKKAVFEGRVEFDAADIAANFEADDAQFRSKGETVRLVMKCGMQGVFNNVTFAGPVSFQDSSFLDLVIGDMKPNAPSVPRLDLSRSWIKRHLSVQKISIQDLVAAWLHVEGPANFTDITVEQSADFSYSDFSTLDFSKSIWPKNAGALHLQAMSYKQIRAAPISDGHKSHEALLKLAGQSAYSADVYGNLEAFFLRQGYRGDADQVFVKGKRRERKEFLQGLPWLGSLLLDWLVGYGRRPWQAGIPCIFFVALGCLLFSAKRMEPQRPDDAPRVYNRFWYSLGLFLPFVDLQADKVWKPKSDQTFLRNYMRVHVLLGWILIPIVLAALTGLIK